MRQLRLLLLSFMVASSLTGCEEAVAPTLRGDIQFTLYGAIDPASETQVVRVLPIRGQLEAPEPGPLDATFVSTDLETGAQVVWRDSLVTLSDGSAGNVFVASFSPAYGHTYELVAEGPEGEPASVVLDVPPLITPILRMATFGAEGVIQEVFWPGAPRVNQARVRLRFQSVDCEVLEFDYTEGVARPLEFGWTVAVPFGRLATLVPGALGVSASQLAILEATASVQVASRAWHPPGGVYDPEALIEPGTFSNVFNGLGFVGASYPSSMSWRPNSEVAQQAGFRPLAFGSCGP